MDNIEKVLWIIFIGVLVPMSLYVSARMITRAVLRTIEEWKERKKNG